MAREPNLLFARAKLLGSEDLDAIGVSGMFEVVDGTNAPDTGRYYIMNIASASETPAARPTMQVAWAAADGVMSVRVRASTTWSSWTEIGAGEAPEAPEAADVPFESSPFYDAALAANVTFDAFATGLGANPPTTVQDAIAVLAYFAATVAQSHSDQLAYNFASSAPTVALNHVTNPQSIPPTGYNLSLNTDGAGANAHNVAMSASTQLGQRVDLTFAFNAPGETVVIKPQGAASGLMDVAGDDITTITIANAADKHVLLEWVQSIKKWRLLDYSFAGVVIV